jgi:hypothetical protein
MLKISSQRMNLRQGEMRAAFGDLDGDGVVDVLLPAEVPGAPLQFEIRAVGGKKGTTLWSRPLNSARSMTAPVVSTAAQIADLDGDGRNEAVVLEFFDDTDGGVTRGEFARLSVLDGENGAERWQWQGPRYWMFAGGHLSDIELLRRPAPQVLRVAGSKEALIAVNLWGQARPVAQDPLGTSHDLPSHWTCIAIFDHLGKLQSHLPLPGARDFAIWPVDVDQDGGDELAVLSPHDGLRLIRPGQENETIWQVDARGGAAEEIWGIGAVAQEDRPVIVVKEVERLLGVDAAQGTLLWQATVPAGRRGRALAYADATPLLVGYQRTPGGRAPHVRRQPRNTSPSAPQLAFTFGDVTIARPAVLATGKASWQPAPAERNRIQSPSSDRRFLRPLPWIEGVDRPERLDVTEEIWGSVWASIVSLTLVFLPGVYFGNLLRQRSWSLRTLLVAPLLLSAALVALSLPVPVPGYSGWSQKWMAGAAALPVWLIATSFWKWARHRRWGRMGGWLGLTIVVAGAWGMLWIAIDLAVWKNAAPYAWDGWYRLWMGAVYWCGWLLFPMAVFGRRMLTKSQGPESAAEHLRNESR